MCASLGENLHDVQRLVAGACLRSGRDPQAVCLVAVSKTVASESIRTLYAAGQRDFGESRLQEALSKMADLPTDIIWHFIGRLQKNKIRRILSEFGYIHSLDSLKMACYMDGVAGESGLRPRVFLQVNLAGEQTKGGFAVDELQHLMPDLLGLRHLELIGLMCIPPFEEDPEASRAQFRRLRQLRDRLEQDHGCCLPQLSMGMSHDFAVAIEEGATFVRVGSALFGERIYPVAGNGCSSDSV